MENILRSGFAALGVDVTDKALAALRRYYELLTERNRVMNLTAIEGEEAVARLHFLDCGALLSFLDLSGMSILDVGSGAGFPGLVLKILCPDTEVTLLDAQRKRMEFQKEVVDALGLKNVRCLHGRAEEMTDMRGKYDLVISRAVAKLSILNELCMPMVRVGGHFIAMKGPDPSEEMAESKRASYLMGGRHVRYQAYTIPGTDVTHTFIFVLKEQPSPSQYPRRYSSIKKQPL